MLLTDGETARGLDGELLGLVREGLHVRIVEVQLATHTLYIYCGEQHPILKAEDLMVTLGHTCDTLSREAGVSLAPAMGQPGT